MSPNQQFPLLQAKVCCGWTVITATVVPATARISEIVTNTFFMATPLCERSAVRVGARLSLMRMPRHYGCSPTSDGEREDGN